MHPLHAALIAAAEGRFPVVDGLAETVRPDSNGTQGCVEFTGHSFVLTTRPGDDVRARGADGFGGATHPDLLRWLAGTDGLIGSHDAVLVARGRGPGARRGGGVGLVERDDLEDHPRVRRARAHRRDVRVCGDSVGLVTLGHGLVGRLELSVELLAPESTGGGAGRALIDAALGLVAAGDLVWAQVAPGNARSLRSFLSCGFVPIGAEVLIQPGRAMVENQ